MQNRSFFISLEKVLLVGYIRLKIKIQFKGQVMEIIRVVTYSLFINSSLN